jgi:hypothetical protein
VAFLATYTAFGFYEMFSLIFILEMPSPRVLSVRSFTYRSDWSCDPTQVLIPSRTSFSTPKARLYALNDCYSNPVFNWSGKTQLPVNAYVVPFDYPFGVPLLSVRIGCKITIQSRVGFRLQGQK